jgi:hypothetical protein
VSDPGNALEPTYRPARELSALEQADLATIQASLLPTLQGGSSGLWGTAIGVACFGIFALLTRAYWFISYPAGAIALILGGLAIWERIESRPHRGYPDRATWTLCEQPDRVVRVRYCLEVVHVYHGNKRVEEQVVIETALGDKLSLKVSALGGRELVSALGRWCPNAAIEIPATWDGGLPEDPHVVLRPAAALPSARVKR